MGSCHLHVKVNGGSTALNVMLLKPTQKAACLGRLAHEAGGHRHAGGEEGEGQDP